MLKIMC